MNWRHDLRLVRINRQDHTLHCEVHGLLPDDEAAEVLQRAGLTTDAGISVDGGTFRPLLRLLDALGKLTRPKCRPIS